MSGRQTRGGAYPKPEAVRSTLDALEAERTASTTPPRPSTRGKYGVRRLCSDTHRRARCNDLLGSCVYARLNMCVVPREQASICPYCTHKCPSLDVAGRASW